MEIKEDTLWYSICGELELSISGASFSSWIKPCYIKAITPVDDERIIIELATPSAYHLKTIDERYYGQIKQIAEKTTSKKCEIALVVSIKETEEAKNEPEENNHGLFTPILRKSSTVSGLNPRFTFDTYVMGNSNSLAYAAAKAVVERPGTQHNPLFIWGGVGVGKTHLMHAVGHALANKGIELITYLTSEQFTNDLVNSLRSKTVDAFKKKYRQVGALLVDDIQFLAGKESTQEEFFHTFNELYMKGVQMVLTSDRKPQEIAKLEERLVSRFLGGLTVDIGLPDYEMRVAILKQKAAEMEKEVSHDVIDKIASNAITNTRQLEGILVQLLNAASLSGGEISNELMEKVAGFKDDNNKRRRVRPITVISAVAKCYEFRNKDIIGKSRKAQLVEARHIAMYLLREELGLQLTRVGELMGGRDHTTVMHAVEKIDQAVNDNNELRRKVVELKHSLYN